MRSLRPIGGYLELGPLRERLAREREAQRLAERIRQGLPAQLRGHCLEARLAEGRLTLLFDSNAWATRARFLAPEILNSLQSYHVREIGFQVRLPENRARVSTPARLSEQAARHLLAAAEQQRDPGLREALRRLARHGLPQDEVEGSNDGSSMSAAARGNDRPAPIDQDGAIGGEDQKAGTGRA